MTRLESKKGIINKTPSEVYNFLLNLKNIELLLPSEKISDFTANDETFSFKITGAIPVELSLVQQEPTKLIQFKTTAKNTFQFDLTIHLTELDDKCEAYQICNADINAFMKIMIEKPLAALFDYMIDKLTTAIA